jgi:agmatine deiminase
VVRFIDGQAVLVNDYAQVDRAYGRCLRSALEKHGLACEVAPCFVEDRTTDGLPSAVGCYVNYLRTERLIVLPVFGVSQDEAALRKFERLFSGTGIFPLQCKKLARQGGCLNCVSWTIRSALPG